jgi:hypothetical protein
MLPVSGRGAVEHFRGPADPAHLLGAERIFEIGELRALELEAFFHMLQRMPRRHEEVPQARRSGFGLQLLDHLDRLPAISRVQLLLIVAGAGADVSLDEISDPVPVKSLPFRKVKVHTAAIPWFCLTSPCQKRRIRASGQWAWHAPAG